MISTESVSPGRYDESKNSLMAEASCEVGAWPMRKSFTTGVSRFLKYWMDFLPMHTSSTPTPWSLSSFMRASVFLMAYAL